MGEDNDTSRQAMRSWLRLVIQTAPAANPGWTGTNMAIELGIYDTDERRMMREMAENFVDEVVLPAANELDPVKGDIPASLIEQMGDLGFFGITIPEELGGLGLGVLEYCIVAEELARGWMSVASIIARGNSSYRSVVGATEAERLAKIGEMAKGRYLAAFAMSEPQAGSDVASISCSARLDGDEWVINGSKYWCTFADGADFITVVCRTSPLDPSRPHLGLTLVPIEKPKGQLPAGVSGSPIPKIGYFGWRTYELHFDNVRTPAIDSGTETGKAFYRIASLLEGARAHTAARSIGCARGAFETALRYAQERQQFGKPIGEFQAIRFKLAKMATEIESARQLMYHVSHRIDQGDRCEAEAAMVKYYAAEMAERVASEALQIMGGAGYTTLYPVERYWRDARLTKIFEGSSEIQLRIVSDSLLGKV